MIKTLSKHMPKLSPAVRPVLLWRAHLRLEISALTHMCRREVSSFVRSLPHTGGQETSYLCYSLQMWKATLVLHFVLLSALHVCYCSMAEGSDFRHFFILVYTAAWSDFYSNAHHYSVQSLLERPCWYEIGRVHFCWLVMRIRLGCALCLRLLHGC